MTPFESACAALADAGYEILLRREAAGWRATAFPLDGSPERLRLATHGVTLAAALDALLRDVRRPDRGPYEHKALEALPGFPKPPPGLLDDPLPRPFYWRLAADGRHVQVRVPSLGLLLTLDVPMATPIAIQNAARREVAARLNRMLDDGQRVPLPDVVTGPPPPDWTPDIL